VTRSKGTPPLALAEAEAIYPAVCAEVRRRHALGVEASRLSASAIDAASRASQYETEAITVARDLATAMQGGAGHSKPPTLDDALAAAKALIAEADASLDHEEAST
jgi:hypothetical protein